MRKIFVTLAILFIIAYPLFAEESRLSDKEASYYMKLEEGRVQCLLCPHECLLANKQTGLCKARRNIEGTLRSLVYARAVSANVDPIEKKPLFHFLPGSKSFSIATAGCNFSCRFCQNWQISQSRPEDLDSFYFPPQEVVEKALENNCQSIAYTYNEPTIFYEYMLDCAKLAREKGLCNVPVTACYINPEPLKELCQYIDGAHCDLKGFSDEFYRKYCSGKLEPVLNTIKTLKQNGVWIEIINLVIPTVNDDMEMIKKMCLWIRDNLGPDVPLHLSRFFPNYKMRDLPPTPVETLEKARKIALDCGLHYVYIGNVPGHPAENTYCPQCKKALIRRVGYYIAENNVVEGKCKFCGFTIAGVWKNPHERKAKSSP
jgi:pyruvate formate lyase activating enzyme